MLRCGRIVTMLYPLLRNFFFALDPETAHGLGLSGVDLLKTVGASCLLSGEVPTDPVEVMGLTFPNPVGLAAGLDKNGEHIDALAALGFGSIEIGTVTPRAQPGNPKPRLFRLWRDRALLNRMGFNNGGAAAAAARLGRPRRIRPDPDRAANMIEYDGRFGKCARDVDDLGQLVVIEPSIERKTSPAEAIKALPKAPLHHYSGDGLRRRAARGGIVMPSGNVADPLEMPATGYDLFLENGLY